MASINIPLVQVQLFFLIFLRVSIILVLLPLFDNKSIPPMLKAGLSLAISFVLFPLLNLEETPLITEMLPFAMGAATEIILGTAIGLTVRLVFVGIQMAGQLAGYQMGFAVVNVIDPISSSQVSIIAQVNYLVAILIFLSLNAHHLLLYAMAESFSIIPPLGYQVSSTLTELLVNGVAEMFDIAIKIGAPVIAAMLLISAALGIVARTVPQMNIFVVAFPLKIIVGLTFIMLALPHMAGFLQETFGSMRFDVLAILKAGQH